MSMSQPGFWAKHSGTVTSLLFATGTGGGVLMVAKSEIPEHAAFFEGLDKVLSVDLFMSIATLTLALVALLIPRLLNESDGIDKLIEQEDKPGNKRLNAFNDLVRAQKRLLASFLFAMFGLANSLAFDGILEYQPPEFHEASAIAHLMNYAGAWADVTEGATSGSLLAASLAFLALGARTFLTAINRISDK
jgi:hypothetical protein